MQTYGVLLNRGGIYELHVATDYEVNQDHRYAQRKQDPLPDHEHIQVFLAFHAIFFDYLRHTCARGLTEDISSLSQAKGNSSKNICQITKIKNRYCVEPKINFVRKVYYLSRQSSTTSGIVSEYRRETNTDNAACFDRAELFDFFDLQSQKAITQMGQTRTTSVSPQRTSSSSDMYGISMKQGATQTLIDSGMVSTEDAPDCVEVSYVFAFLKGASLPIYSHIVPKV